MKAVSFSLTLALALVALAGASCDDAGGGDELVGKWLRTRSLEVGTRLEVERWRLEIKDDGTFVELHDETYDANDLDSYPYEMVDSRQGSWSKSDEDHITLTGEWLDFGGPEIESLGDLADSLYTFTREAMIATARDGRILLVGPDITYFTGWPHSESYSVMYNDQGNNTLWRTSFVELVDADGTVLQSVDESLTIQVAGDLTCSGEIELVESGQGGETQASGPLIDCTYTVSDAVEIQDTNDGVLSVQSVVFEYEANGLSGLQREHFIQVGEHYLGYNQSEQAMALKNSAFVRAD